MRNRYEYLVALIAIHKPVSIIEIGVHKGYRAMYMAEAALLASPEASIHYDGFDVFETESAEFQEAALNGKGMPSKADAERALTHLQSRFPGRFTWALHIGKTEDTLHRNPKVAGFVFIDGDHRSSVIEEDYKAVAGSKVVAFDDYYKPDNEGKTPDLKMYGANSVVDLIPNKEILPHGDPCRHGGFAHVAVIV